MAPVFHHRYSMPRYTVHGARQLLGGSRLTFFHEVRRYRTLIRGALCALTGRWDNQVGSGAATYTVMYCWKTTVDGISEG